VTGRPRPNYSLARPLFIREANASFGHAHHTSSAAMKKCASLGGVIVATGVTSRRVLVYLLVFLG
jgi:hypothetical protein